MQALRNHPLLKSKTRLAALASMTFLLQCCCCILPVGFQYQAGQETRSAAPAERFVTSLPQGSQVCALGANVQYAHVPTRQPVQGQVLLSENAGQTWQWTNASLPVECKIQFQQ